MARVLGDDVPLVSAELAEGARQMHWVLDAERCYELVAVADERLSLSLRDEHDHELASRSGRWVRLGPVCPRWTGSFSLDVNVIGDRGRVWLREIQPSASSASLEVTRSISR